MATMNHCTKCHWRMGDTCYVYAKDPELGPTLCSDGDSFAGCLEFKPVRLTRAKIVPMKSKWAGRYVRWTPLPRPKRTGDKP